MTHGFGDVALLGLGESTQAAGAYLASLPAGSVNSITVYAGACSDAARARGDALAALGARVVYGVQELEHPYDLGVPSPGIPATGPFYASGEAMCATFVSEPELAWRESPRDWLAITGTNGKTTTTTLTCELLKAAGLPARTVGNIGLPPIACVAERAEGEVFVAELSSFQLHGCERFAPRAAALLNVTPDHLEWHGTLEDYAASKERVFANMTPRDLCVVGNDEACTALAVRLRARGLRVAVLGEEPLPCAGEGAWVASDGLLTVRNQGREHALCTVDDLRIKGPHNVLNALAAAALAIEAGAAPELVAQGLRDFAPLAHRVEPCGTVAGVSYFDDSKGTNTDAVEKALVSFEPGRTVLMLGGYDKGTDLTSLAALAVARCKAVVAYGAAGPRIHAALVAAREALPSAGTPCACELLEAPRMRPAFDAARACAAAGDVVLLSPACSSFDEFGSYKERGEVFQTWVADLAQAERSACAGSLAQGGEL